MANFGRVVCVALPFLLTLASLISLLVAGLAGVADKSLYMFQVNTTNLSIDPLTAANLISKATGGKDVETVFNDAVNDALNTRQDTQTTNITAADLSLYDLYDVGLWGYCYTPQNGSRECTRPAFDWATNVLNTTTGDLNSMLTLTGQNVTLPKEITDAVKAFSTVSKWTQVVFIISYVALGVALFFGLFANCSRAFSCITWLLAAFAAVAVCASAALATATAVVVVGAVEGSAKIYGVRADFNTRFLAAVWIAAAFALAAALFWVFTICCCAPEKRSGHKRNRSSDEGEKLMGTGPYQRLDQPQGYQGYQQQWPAATAGNGGYGRQTGGAYEPYSHSRV
ncbi:hypothetical protein QC763_106930 [Podospora pseudopauciseta]|uniref:SUR7 protein n=4 Tax=Podospora TaxID=5144 RepID=A0ABY6RV36_PODCO|nr:hypothetical protein QC761_106930 [Podospora bellae-mahoneyi]KAK4672884.1 hypothetical protein QC763_106930 [Podospora pseudopauciseta]KAK4681387.1 hypothetical protein QC764_106930 [Podospora pseudoanserina]VBB72112.1 Putative protein of unknown function [Podospora comata]